jgi:predicted Zn-dependent peptidase
MLRKWFTDWKGSKSIRALPKPEPSAAKKVYLIDRPGSVQSTIRIGTITVDRRHEDFIPLYVMNQIVGVGPGARLFRKLREEKGYTYGVFSDLTEEAYRGVWTIRGDVRTEVTEEAITEILKEVLQIRDERVQEDELEEAKRAIISLFALNLEESRLWMLYGLAANFCGLDLDYWDKFPDEIGRVSAKDVQRVAQRYLNPDSLQIVVVGDGRLLENALRKFGPIELYNAEGELRKK